MASLLLHTCCARISPPSPSCLSRSLIASQFVVRPCCKRICVRIATQPGCAPSGAPPSIWCAATAHAAPGVPAQDSSSPSACPDYLAWLATHPPGCSRQPHPCAPDAATVMSRLRKHHRQTPGVVITAIPNCVQSIGECPHCVMHSPPGVMTDAREATVSPCTHPPECTRTSRSCRRARCPRAPPAAST